MHRFFHPTDTPEASDVSLSPEESHHALRVLRVRRGDPVELFDGKGHAWRGAVAETGKKEVRVELDEVRFVPRPEPGVTLAQAWLHRDKLLDELVSQATVLGVDCIVFFRAEHSEKKPRLNDKWKRLAIEACKQCGRLWIPNFGVTESLADVLAHARDGRVVMACMEPPHQPLASLSADRPVTYLVGPEGDFSAMELAIARGEGAISISLGDYTLRSEMAALVGLTLIQYHLGRIGQP